MKAGGVLSKVLLLVIASAFFGVVVFASTSDGTIDANSKYAWGSKIGWVNWGATGGDVHITNTALTGNIWNDNYGWIKLNPTTGGVVNDGVGNLSGYAWSAQLGWINFAGVTINSSTGIFSGQATGDNIGMLNFNCTYCAVKTDWRVSAGTVETETPIVSPGGGGGLPPGATTAPVVENLSVFINGGLADINTTTVGIQLRAGNDIAYAWVAEDSNYIINATRYIFDAGVTERNVVYLISKPIGQKTIFVKFCTPWGHCSNNFVNLINYTPAPITTISPVANPVVGLIEPETEDQSLATIIAAPVKEGIKYFENLMSKAANSLAQALSNTSYLRNVASLGGALSQINPLSGMNGSLPRVAQLFSNTISGLSRFFGIKSVEPPADISKLVSAQAPFAMNGNLILVSPQSVNRFVFAPLPKEFLALANKFPGMKQTFAQVGVNRMGNLEKLKNAEMYLPGLSQAMGLTVARLGMAQYGAMTALPVGELPTDLKNKIPSDIVFARVGSQLVDSKVALSLTPSGKPEQKITTISGKTMYLTVRPDKPVTRVRGFIMFRSRTPQARAEMPLSEIIASVIFAQPAFAREATVPVPTEEKLVLQEFEYTDPDGDGLYTANIESPRAVGEYEIVTVMDYVDPDLGTKQIRLITVVDPEGYVFEKIGDKEMRIPGAIASIYYFNPDSKQYELWPAGDFQQENPQVTNISGSYSFLVPGGMYYLKVTAPGYEDYSGKPFAVTEGGGVHMNIELKTRYWWIKMIDWRTGLLIAVALLLVYNFYKDKKRAK